MRNTDIGFYKSSAWKKIRKEYIASVGGLCERCMAKGIIEPAYIVHHKIHLNNNNVNDASVSLNFDNLEALCFTCHNQEHFGEKEQRRYKVDDQGQIIFVEE